MTTIDSEKWDEKIAISRKFAKQQYWSVFAMLASAILAYCLVKSIAIGPDALALSIAAATAFTVGVCCAPDMYRGRSGSLTLAISLIAFMWSGPAVILLLSLI